MASLTYNSVDLRTSDGKIRLDLVQGFWDPADVRGKDVIVPSRAGRVEGSRVKDVRTIRLVGWVKGSGTTGAARWASLYTSMAALAAVFTPVTPANLVVTAPYLGLSAGTKTIRARAKSVVFNDPLPAAAIRVDIELESVASPPEWT